MNADEYTVSDGNSITFIERVPWSRTGNTETELELLRHCMVIKYLVTVNGFYLVLLNMDPIEFERMEPQYTVAHFTVNDETGAVEVHSMKLTGGQVDQLCRAGEWFE